jgi:HEPN domain-containing protein
MASAEADLLACKAILAAAMPSYETASFHAQQAAEKALKALLIRHQVRYSKTHDQGELLQLAEPVAAGIARALPDVEGLTPHAVDTRYPTANGPVDRDTAARDLATAERVCNHARSLLGGYLDASAPAG